MGIRVKHENILDTKDIFPVSAGMDREDGTSYIHTGGLHDQEVPAGDGLKENRVIKERIICPREYLS